MLFKFGLSRVMMTVTVNDKKKEMPLLPRGTRVVVCGDSYSDSDAFGGPHDVAAIVTRCEVWPELSYTTTALTGRMKFSHYRVRALTASEQKLIELLAGDYSPDEPHGRVISDSAELRELERVGHVTVWAPVGGDLVLATLVPVPAWAEPTVEASDEDDE
jgi:hypothetical protein